MTNRRTDIASPPPVGPAFEEDFYRRLIEEGAEVVLLVDAAGRVAWANEAAAHLLGTPREECVGTPLVDCVHREDRKHTQRALARWLEADPESTARFENRIRSRDGRVSALRWSVRRRAAGPEGCGEHVVLTGYDVTQQKRYERALLESEARHRALLAGVLEPLVIIDALGTIQSVSDSVLPVLGYEPAELVGRNVKILLPSPHREQHDQYLENYAETGETHILGRTREFQVVRRDGVLIECELSVSRVDVPGQAEPLFCGSLRDVTRRRQVERALLEREAIFRAIFDQEFQFVGLCAPNGTLLEANHTALDAVGARREEVVGRPFWETPWWDFSEESRQRLREAVRDAARGEFVRFQFEMLDVHGSQRAIDFSLKPVRDEDGAVTMLIPEGRDVTDLEEARRIETRMMGALAELGESAAVLAHEVKNPITAVNLALRTVADRIGEDSKAVLEDLVGRMQRLERTLRTTLTFAKPLELDRRPVRSADLLNGVLSRLRVDFARAGVVVDARESFEDVQLSVDESKLAEVFDNLLRNAMQATGSGGRVLVGCRRTKPGWLRITVEDDGPGIPDDLRASVFKPFVTGKMGGTGLGLPICRRIVEEHDGSIDAADSDLGGACFKVRLPIEEPGDDG